MIDRTEKFLERLLWASRWIIAPFYVGLIGVLLVLLVLFGRELVTAIPLVPTMKVDGAILIALGLIDLVLLANLVLIVILSGYENFVSKIDIGDHEDRPSWMGNIGFSDLKLKLFTSIVAISGIQLLKVFMSMGAPTQAQQDQLFWLVIVHVVFVVTTLMSAATDWLSSRAKGSKA